MKTKKKKAVPKKKASKKKLAVKKTIAKKSPVGRVSHYFDNIKVAAIKLKAPLKKGDTVRIEGGTTVVKLRISSMQKEHKAVSSAKAKDEVGIKVAKKVREGYRVYKLPRPPV